MCDTSSISLEMGLPEMVYQGDHGAFSTVVRLFDFSTGNLTEVVAKTLEDLLPFLHSSSPTWIDWVGLKDVALLSALCQEIGVHPLHVEDLLHTNQRSKVNENEDYLLLFVRRLFQPEGDERLDSDQIAFLMMDNLLLTVRERDLGLFAPVQVRLRSSKGRFLSMGVDYLTYSLLDALIDSYFEIMELQEEAIDEVQDLALSVPDSRLLAKLHKIRGDLIITRRCIWPMREAVNALSHSELITPEVLPFLRDAQEHMLNVVDTLEFARDLLNATTESYLSSSNQRMNETIRVLTVISLIFMPLSFITGVYGMNFTNMPGLSWRYGYVGSLIVMVGIALGMILYFRRKRWM